MKTIVGYLRACWLTTWNIIAYMVSGGKYLSLEGRVRKGFFRNWAGRFRHRPSRLVQPETIEEIADLVQKSHRLRVFGSGHSFNEGVVTDETLVSLDKCSGVVGRDVEKKQLTVRGGTRIRDVVAALYQEGWAFTALPSHDAQSIGGILSTDVHGAGRDWGFVSQSIVELKIVDGRGEIIACGPADPLFHAAIGGVGAVGIIAEVVVQGVDRFNIEQRTEVADLTAVEQNLEQLIQANDHLSLYLFPFTNQCQINTWNHTTRRQSFLGPLREFLSISSDTLLVAWGGDFMAFTGFLPHVSPYIHQVRKASNLVLESAEGFNRNVYHAHQELEFTIPYDDTFATCRRLVQLYEQMYPGGLPYTIIEVRFTPSGHDRTLLGPGQTQRCAWIDLVCNDSAGFERYFMAAEEVAREIGGRPHLGKYCHSWQITDFQRLYPQKFALFQQLVAKHDPQDKFTNQFTRRLFGHPSSLSA